MDETFNLNVFKKRAVKAALNHDWDKAIELNKEILLQYPEDSGTLNRLAFAHSNNGEVDKAKKCYSKVLNIDSQNPIASKALKKLKNVKSNGVKKQILKHKVNTSFIEEPGLTKTIRLLKPAKSDTLVQLSPGLPVNLTCKKRKVSVETESGDYVGCFPDDLGLRISRLINIGYTYNVHVKGIDDNLVTVFVKEASKSPRGKNIPSFPSSGTKGIADLSKITKIDDIPVDVSATGEND